VIDLARAVIDIADDPADLARRAAAWIVAQLSAHEGLLAVALAGGATPRPLYERLAAAPQRDRLPWPRIHWFWGDFPGDGALEEKSRWAVAVRGARSEPRITLTLPALASSRAVAFLAAGGKKRGALSRLFADAPDLPAARLEPMGGIYFFLDRAAAPEPLP
jgi:6-phosphogluconolactonase/glucosamine-6-phosphate isomerase/deaminase